MKQKILNTFIALSLVLVPMLAQPTLAYADCPSSTSSKGQILKGVGETGSDCSDSGVMTTIRAVVDILSLITGIAAIIVIIYAGLKYVTSGGDSGKVSSAKNTLIYALVGLAVAALAQFLVHFALHLTKPADMLTPLGRVSPTSDSSLIRR